jgi:hypothetical protein
MIVKRWQVVEQKQKEKQKENNKKKEVQLKVLVLVNVQMLLVVERARQFVRMVTLLCVVDWINGVLLKHRQ